MSFLKTRERAALDMASSIGKVAMASLFPLDFEAYVMGLELTDSRGNPIIYMTWPVMVNSFRENYTQRTVAINSFSGTSIITNPNFSPRTISMSGSFGRSFKWGGDELFSGSLFNFTSYKRLNTGFGGTQWSLGQKTGFGYARQLQLMIEESTTLDVFGKPKRLYLYNMSLNENYQVIVPASGFSLSQNSSNNMIWEYELSFLAIAPISGIGSYKQMIENTLTREIVSTTVTDIKTVISTIKTVISTIYREI